MLTAEERKKKIVLAHVSGASYRMISYVFGVAQKKAIEICVAELGKSAKPARQKKKLRNPQIGEFAALCDGDPIVEKGVKFFDLEPSHCRYPVARDPVDMSQRFCGERKLEGFSYCECHARLCVPGKFIAEAA